MYRKVEIEEDNVDNFTSMFYPLWNEWESKNWKPVRFTLLNFFNTWIYSYGAELVVTTTLPCTEIPSQSLDISDGP